MIPFAQLPEIDSQGEPVNIFKWPNAERCERCEQRSKFLERRKVQRRQWDDEARDLTLLGGTMHSGEPYVDIPANSSCPACEVLWSLAQGILHANGIVFSTSISLMWHATRSQLLVVGPNENQTRLFQIFIPRGETA